ncbi:CCR-like [Striga hermonthica]|uniref:CCR-like n=1 Tax=Striga hermonthica TaxID=68872 RepID=A0A9N7NAJ3_STRHE|nr:CCR-like [Striga hermonthica]
MGSGFSINTPPKVIVISNSSSRFASFNQNALAVNYNSTISVFPAEACETIGGETCLADMYPEVKLQPQAEKPKGARPEAIEREYMDYTDSRTVLQGEACDVLRGEFCPQAYQMGIS